VVVLLCDENILYFSGLVVLEKFELQLLGGNSSSKKSTEFYVIFQNNVEKE
jgi:hypothetical protein